MAKQFTLGKNERLKSRKQIEQLFSKGKSFPLSPFRIYYQVTPLITSSSSTLQFGAGVSGKNFKRAVDRNRVKRLTREAYRLQKKQLQEATIEKKLQLNIFFIYTGKELPAFNIVREKVNVILNKLTKIVNENNSPDT
ncbi:MAG TPA: ribonuclease P protein component [Chitinophagaceae bacterium]|nr:ribonuclease P protein component [Chitinophagaceae bacterium]